MTRRRVIILGVVYVLCGFVVNVTGVVVVCESALRVDDLRGDPFFDPDQIAPGHLIDPGQALQWRFARSPGYRFVTYPNVHGVPVPGGSTPG